MKFNVRFEEGLGIISGAITGDLTRQIAADYFAEVGKVTVASKCMRVLTDLRNAQLKANDLDMADLSKQLRFIGIGQAVRRALLISDDVRGYKAWENYCFREGYLQIRLFVESEKAIDWLKAG